MKNEKGITLIALLITIIVLIILASISISTLSGDESVIDQTIQAKEGVEIEEEKRMIELAAMNAMGKNKFGEIVYSEFKKELDNTIGDESKREYELSDKNSENKFIVTYKDTQRKYSVDSNAAVKKIN